MKKDLPFGCFVLLIILCFSTFNLAQNNSIATGKAPGSHHISNFSNIKISDGIITPCRYVYYYDVNTSMIGRLSLDGSCPGGDLASWTPPFFATGGVQGGNGNFYILDVTPKLCQLDTSNGNVTILGLITGTGAVPLNGIAYDAVNDSYYLCGYTGSANNLYKLDINTLTATLVSNIGSTDSPVVTMAINSNGVGYAYDQVPESNAYTFDPVSGASTLLGSLGFNANYAQDMDIDIETGIIYLAAYNLDFGEGELRTMDPNTGMTTLLYPFGDQISVLEFDNLYSTTPVELTSFTAGVNQNNVVLNWTTSTETNNKGFEVERKSVDEQYQDIAFVNGYGTTTQPHQYGYIDKNPANAKYLYRLKQIDFDGTFKYTKQVEIDVALPVKFSLGQNYPNPFNPTTKIEYSIPSTSHITLKVYDVIGREVKTLVDDERQPGNYSVQFDAADLPSGVYFYKLKTTPAGGQAGIFSASKKLILIK